MGKIIAEVEDDLEKRFKKTIIDKHGKLRGFISQYIKEAIELWLEKNKEREPK